MLRRLFPLLELNDHILFLLSCWCPVGGDTRRLSYVCRRPLHDRLTGKCVLLN